MSDERTCRHEESLYGRCTACGKTWEQQTAERAAASRLYEDGGRQAGIDYMDEPVKCQHCGITTTRRDAIIHIQHPCPELLASQQAGEALIARIQEQEDANPFLEVQ
jgi:hypothetical protein